MLCGRPGRCCLAPLADTLNRSFNSASDELAAVYDDRMFACLYPARGQPAHSPWRLALVTLLQFATAGGRRGPGADRLEVCVGPGARRSRVRLLRSVPPCCMDRGCGRIEPYPCFGSCD